MIHYDVMDGNYVPNIMLGTETYKAIHGVTDIPIDLHLMCSNPDKAVDYFDIKKNDRVCFHPQTIDASYSLLKKIKDLGAKAGIAFNPGTPIGYIDEFQDLLDFVLIMGVEPGFSGQKMLPHTFNKLARVQELRNQYNLNFEIFVDGDCTAENAKKLLLAGVDGVAVGSALIRSDTPASDFSKTYKNYEEVLYS